MDPIVAGEKLASMESAEDIAYFLQSQGVKGRKTFANSCAIARWVADVSGQRVWVCNVGISSTNSIFDIIVEASKPMKEFMMKFDRGGYPELEEFN